MKHKKLIINLVLSLVAIVAIIAALVVLLRRPVTAEGGTIKVELIDSSSDYYDLNFFEFSAGDSLFKIIEKNYEIEYELSAYGHFMIRIGALNAPNRMEKFIRIEVNDKISTQGIDHIKLKDQDKITFRIVKVGDTE